MTETAPATAEHLAALRAAPDRPQYRRELLPRELCEAVVSELQNTAADPEAQALLDLARQHLRAHEALQRRETHQRLRKILGAPESDRAARARRFGEKLRQLEAEAAQFHSQPTEN